MRKFIFAILSLVLAGTSYAGGSVGGGSGIILEKEILAPMDFLDIVAISKDELFNIKKLQIESFEPIYLHAQTRVLEIDRAPLKLELEALSAKDLDTNQSVLLIAE